MYGSTEIEFEREEDLLLIIMTLHIDGRTFPSVVKINEQILIAWKLANIATEPSIHKMFEAEARRLYMNVNIQPYWNDNFIHEVWFSRMMTDYHGFYNDASVTIGPHGWELTISPGKTQEFLETVQSIYEHSPRPTPQFNVAEILTFIEEGDNVCEEKIRRYTAEEITEICQKWAEGARNFGYAHPEVIDALNAIPCTSFWLKPEEVEALLEKDGEE